MDAQNTNGAAEARKKRDKNKSSGGSKNRKAFGVANIGRSQRNVQRNLDKAQQKEVKPLTNKSLESVQQQTQPPPPLVVVMGPRGVGKSTLIRSLVKLFTGQNLADTVGPITVAASKQRRVTLFECPLDLYSMTDLAKVADLVLLMVDASYGFEMETFEYLNLLQLHGFPKVMAIFTHLDKFKASKTLQNTKKALKHRFWTEIYKGAKVFEFMGVLNGKYRKHEVKRLALYVSRVKFRPLVWRNTHPYILVDRVEDVTPVKAVDHALNGEEDGRDVALFGYVRGSNLKAAMKIHLIGAGDFPISALSALPDPCPLQSSTENGKGATLKRQKDSLLYAPLANVGRVSMDSDGLYIELKHINYSRSDQLHIADQQHQQKRQQTHSDDGNLLTETPVDILRSMQHIPVGVDQQLTQTEGGVGKQSTALSLFAGDDEMHSENYDSDMSGDEQSECNSSEDEKADHYVEEDDDNDDGSDFDAQAYDGEDCYDSDSSSEVEHTESDIVRDDTKIRSNWLWDINQNAPSSVPSIPDDPHKSPSLMQNELGRTGHVDIMRAVYGWHWMSNENVTNNSDAQKLFSIAAEVDQEDEELFGSYSSSCKTAMKRRQYAIRNAVNSSRVWMGGVADMDLKELELSFLAEQPAVQSIGGSASKCIHGGGISFSSVNQLHNRNGAVIPVQSDSNESHNKIDLNSIAAALCTVENFDAPADADSVDSDSPSRVDELQCDWLWTALKTRCVTGGWDNKVIRAEDTQDSGDLFEDFEDLQTGEVHRGSSTGRRASEQDNDSQDDDENFDDGENADDADNEAHNEDIDRQLRNINARKKAQFKITFDQKYDNKELDDLEVPLMGGQDSSRKGKKRRSGNEEGEQREELDFAGGEYMEAAKRLLEEKRERNALEFAEDAAEARVQLEGFRQGIYVRVLIRQVPEQFIQNFRAEVPCVLGGLLHHEADNMGFITARVKRHRWHKRVLKSSDPLIFSIGWRRYQSIPVYTTIDQNERERYLKYTPEHMHCTATFYGPLIPPNTGVLGFQSADNTRSDFRISLTGTVLAQRATPQIVKKLKLVGTPVKIYKNSAFVTGMFTSALEVAKFEHAKLKTVSGIRGTIKKALRESNSVHGGTNGGLSIANLAKQPPGTFRATFEDKILLSDLVVCRLWVPVIPKEFYNPVLTLLHNTPAQSSTTTTDTNDCGPTLMRTTAQLRRDLQVPQVINKDSLYKPVQRVRREFKKLKIPSKLQEALPFASKPKQQRPLNRQSYLVRRSAVVVREPEERNAQAAVQRFTTLKNIRVEKRKAAAEQRRVLKRKVEQRETDKFYDEHREQKKQKHREEGKRKAREQQKQQNNKKHRAVKK